MHIRTEGTNFLVKAEKSKSIGRITRSFGYRVSVAITICALVVSPITFPGVYATADADTQETVQCPLVIDSFSQPYDAITYSARPAHYVATSGLGGELDVLHTITSSATPSGSEYTDTVIGAFNISNGVLTDSTVLLVWDGSDNNPNAINYSGLNGVDFSAAGQRDSIDFTYSSDFIEDKKVVLTFRIYSGAGNASEAVLELYGPSSTTLSGSVLLTSFSPILGSGADMSNVGAVSLLIDMTSRTAIDFTLDSIQLPCDNPPTTTTTLPPTTTTTLPPTTTTTTQAPSKSVDLRITKDAGAESLLPGQSLTFYFVVANAGPDTATNVVVSDILPAGLTYVSSTSTVGVYNPSTGQWPIGTMTVNQSETLRIQVTVNANTAGQTLVNTATVAGSEPETNTQNNTDSASVIVTGTTTTTTLPPTTTTTTLPPGGGGGGDFVPYADVSITKSVSTATSVRGSQIAYTIMVKNSGPYTATGVSVQDTLPSGLEQIVGSASLGNFNSLTGLWTVGSLAVNEQATLTITAKISDTAACGPIANRVAVTVSNPATDINNVNNSATVTSQIVDCGTVSGTSTPAPTTTTTTIPPATEPEDTGLTLGATTELPRTGLPALPLALALLFGSIPMIARYKNAELWTEDLA